MAKLQRLNITITVTIWLGVSLLRIIIPYIELDSLDNILITKSKYLSKANHLIDPKETIIFVRIKL
jgi:hypothetical protein